jgi:hypothetical protein
MSFVHDDREFDDLLQIVGGEHGLSRGLVEKDYWVTHSLWALHDVGFEVWFKGGTSLSKGFSLIQRFSEDLDLKIEAGKVSGLPAVSSWKSEGKTATTERKAYFEQIPRLLRIPGATDELDLDSVDKAWRSANLRVAYPGRHLGDLHGVLSPFVRLEVGSARVTPFVERDLSSFVHEKLLAQGQLHAFDDNRPRAVRCVHPLVTLLEKLDALRRRFPNDGAPIGDVRSPLRGRGPRHRSHYHAPASRGRRRRQGTRRRHAGAEANRGPSSRDRPRPGAIRWAALGGDPCRPCGDRTDVLGGDESLSTRHARPFAPGSRPSSSDGSRRRTRSLTAMWTFIRLAPKRRAA